MRSGYNRNPIGKTIVSKPKAKPASAVRATRSSRAADRPAGKLKR
jgi:hypothetical protein